MVCSTKNPENSKRCSKFNSYFVSINSNYFGYRRKNIIFLTIIFLALSALKIKGLTAFQIWQLWRILNFLRSSGRYSYFGQGNQSSSSGNLTTEECYKVLGIKKPCSKEDVIKAAAQLQKKIHPDLNKNQNTEYLSKVVNNAKDIILKNDFN